MPYESSASFFPPSFSPFGSARNRFLVPSKQVHIKCGGSLPLEEWQTKYGQDPGATVEALPPIAVLLEDAQALLRV